MSATTPLSPLPTKSAPRSPWWVGAVLGYVGLLLAAFVTGNLWLDQLAALILMTLLLLPGLRRRSVASWALWLLGVVGLAVLAARGNGRVALDGMPVFINMALCLLFAHTLARGREPLIARVIAVLEGPARLTLPRVAIYARRLTLAWALLFGTQALLLAALIACAVPDGVLATFGLRGPFVIAGENWRWYLHLGSYASLLAFLTLEYAFRRWHLRHIPHAPLPLFIGRLARRWPDLVRSLADDPVPTER